ncbi:Putative L-lactate dehydrogenase operon regulatory protein [Baekduia alba]|uniref:FadR/GntR family transcriptional regulator n=1 Tax=Baekduia alba TaxID=2997333 RepID=UPI002341BC7F|nr:FCD domain-containing protein [Baekduia alba]WCB93002.1 Putative L-lactate dehydrogenase operon regulatory protein [Baekduia alba]
MRQRYEQVADRLVEDLRRGTLRPGARLPGERDLAATLGVGRASVREALGALAVRGIVETRPGAGSFITDDAAERLAASDALPVGLALPADAGPDALLAARRAFEPEIAALAAARGPGSDPIIDELLAAMEQSADPSDAEQRRRWSDADRAFHRQLAVATGNPVILAVADHLASLMDQPLWRQLRDESTAVPGRTTLQLAEHRLIAAAIADGDAAAARTHTAQHIDRARRFMALD